MYNQRPNLILGFHGCDETVRDQLLLNPNNYKMSKENYDWLACRLKPNLSYGYYSEETGAIKAGVRLNPLL